MPGVSTVKAHDDAALGLAGDGDVEVHLFGIVKCGTSNMEE
jgi:hypothetical protein